MRVGHMPASSTRVTLVVPLAVVVVVVAVLLVKCIIMSRKLKAVNSDVAI